MAMTISDAFNQRKKLATDLQSWCNRLSQAGEDKRSFRCKQIEGAGAFQPEPGSEKFVQRHYTIEECQKQIEAVLEKDRELALRISLTNQRAKAKVVDLDGQEREMTVPELLVLKNDIVPKLEQAARSLPTRPENVSVYESGEGLIRHRAVKKIERKKETLTDKGMKVEDVILEGYEITETTSYGRPQREVWNQIDRIQEFGQRVQQALNETNKTELVELK